MERVGLDSLPAVTEDEALELCVHHLQLAAIYFNNVSHDIEANLEEAKKIITRGAPSYVNGNPAWEGAKGFLISSQEAHEQLEQKFP